MTPKISPGLHAHASECKALHLDRFTTSQMLNICWVYVLINPYYVWASEGLGSLVPEFFYI